VLEQALAAGHDVTVLTREAGKVADSAAGDRLRVVVGGIEQYESVVDVVAGSEAVISALGPTRNAADQVELFGRWAGHLVRATEAHGPARVVILSGAAVNVPGEQKAIGDRIASAVVRAFVRHVVAAKQAEFEIISRSSLECIAARPRESCQDRARGATRSALTFGWVPGPGSVSPIWPSSCCAR